MYERTTAQTTGRTTNLNGTRQESRMIDTEGYVAPSIGAALELRKLQLSPLQDTEVQVEMKYCGLCHTDLHMKNNDWGVSDYPLVPGHEGVGIIRDVGAKVVNLTVGDYVGIGWLRNSCGTCIKCLEGRENLCAQGYQGIYLAESAGCWGKRDCRLQGCFARLIHIAERFAFKLPMNLLLETLAPLMCAGVTVWEPICEYVRPGVVCGVVSLGGLGHMAVKLIHAIGGSVCVFSSSNQKKEKAIKELDVKYYVNYTNRDEMEKMKGQIDVMIDTCPLAQSITPYMDCLRLGGTYVKVGIPATSTQSLTYDYIPLVFTGKRIAGSVVSGTRNTRLMLQLAGDHKISSNVEIMPFTEVNEAIRRLEKCQNQEFRIVLKW